MPRRGLLTGVSIIYIIVGVLELIAGLIGAFAGVWLTIAGLVGWGIALMIISLFEGILMLSAGITGLRAGARTGSSILGALVFLIALFGFIISLIAAPRISWSAILALILAILYLIGVKRAYR